MGSIEFRFYRQRYNTDPAYYTGDKDVYLNFVYPTEESLLADWHNLFEKGFDGRILEGETYSAWDEYDNLICGGAFDPDDINYILPNYTKKKEEEKKVDNWYGIPKMTFEEEVNLPPLAKRTLGNKIKIVDWCDNMEHVIETIRNRAKGTPIKDDERHSDLVQKWTLMVMQANRLLDDCAMFGRD